MLKKILTVCACALVIGTTTACSKKEQEPSDFDMTDISKDEPQKQEDTTSSDETELTPYQKQSIVTAINNKLSSMYDTGTCGYVSLDSLTLTRDADGNVVAETEINRTDNGNQYSTPAKFTMLFDSSSNSFSVKDENVDSNTEQTIAKDSKTSSSGLKKDSLPTDMSEQSSFDITVSSGITLTLDTSSGGHGAAYAVSDSGQATLLCDAQSESKTETVSLAAGHYTVKLYADEGTHWSWQYNAN